ncbi:MAG: RNA polymerase sigma-70 factor (ECF subfamily) [Acidimicrobiales bacterium]|jgi:RNA polymerase sigma-70 factor (ECF subfamily)
MSSISNSFNGFTILAARWLCSRAAAAYDVEVSTARRKESKEGQDGFTRYVMPELDVLLRVARSITGNVTDADDLVQDTLLRAYRAIDKFDGRYPRAWLLTIMRNAQINRVRRKRPELMRDPETTLAVVANTDSDAKTPESLVIGQTFDAAVERSLAAIPSQFREAIHLVDIDGLSYNEAAAVLDVPVGTIMSRLHRGRKLIRNDLTLDPNFERASS